MSNIYLELMKKEISPALGCTEPGAIGLAVAKSHEILGKDVDKVIVYLSRNMLKNAMGVGIPGTNRVGIETAVALAVLIGKSEYLLEVFRDVTTEDLINAEKFVNEGRIQVEMADTDEKLYIRAVCISGNDSAETIIQTSHTNIVMIIHNGTKVYLQKEECTRVPESSHSYSLKVADIFKYITEAPVSELEFLQEAVDMNLTIAKEGLEDSYGLCVGKMEIESLVVPENAGMEQRAVALTAAAADARMAGCSLPVMSTTGSGNQGITASVPVIVYAKELKVGEEKMYRALALSNLAAIHQKTPIGRLSAYCGAVSAGAGAGAGIAYLCGGGFKEIAHTVVNSLAIVSGIVCDGAKASCAAKIASAVEAGILGYNMYIRGQQFYGGDGIVTKGVEETLQNVGRLGKEGMKETNEEIIKIMIGE